MELRAVPTAGLLLFRNAVADGGVEPDAELAVGSTFSQADVLGGLIVYKQTSTTASVRSDSFTLALAGAPVEEEVVYRLTFIDNAGVAPFSLAGEQDFSLADGLPVNAIDLLCETMSRDLGCVIWDASTELDSTKQAGAPSADLTDEEYQHNYIPDFGVDRSVVMRGGVGDDLLEGGKEADVLMGGPGDDILAGHGGGDLYVWLSSLDGSDTIESFSAAGGDVLDVSRILNGSSENVTNYISLAATGTNSRLTIRTTGVSSDPEPMSILVEGPELAQMGLFDAVENGSVLVGTKVLSPRVQLVVVTGQASENGPVAAKLEITRSGDIRPAVTVGLQFSGTAVNGSDYYLLPSSVTLEAGQTSASLSVLPYVDAVSEGTEFATVTILPGTGYSLGASTATISIEDLLPQISVSATKPLAVQNGTAGRFSIRRAGVMTEGLYVDLVFGGTAVMGIDYPSLSDSVYFAPNVAEVRVDVAPLPSADLSQGKSLILQLVPDSMFKIMVPSADMMLAKETLTLAQWQDRYFPGATTNLDEFAAGDSGDIGVRNILRYAFGLDPYDPDVQGGAPRIEIVDGRFGVMFRKPASITDMNYIVLSSDDLRTWTSSDVEPAPTGKNDAELMFYRSKRPLSEAGKQFILINVEKKP